MPESGDDSGGLLVRATINLPGIERGEVVEADPETDYVKSCLAAGYLIPVGTAEPRPAGE